MGRKLKKGLDYFPLYHDFFSNKDIKMLRRAHGSIGILTYLALLCRIYDNGYYYKFDDINELAMDIAEEIANDQLRRTATCVAETINYLVKHTIFDENLFEGGVISSAATQEQYALSAYKAKRKIEMDVYCLIDVGNCIQKNAISPEEITISPEEITIPPEESAQIEENKNKISISQSIARVSAEKEKVVEKPDENCEGLNRIKGALLSEKQIEALLEVMTLDEFDHYVDVITSCEQRGHKYKTKSHYQAIIDMVKRDRKL